MTIVELMRELARLFPQAFPGEGLKAWTQVYRDGLEVYQGVPLGEGFRQVMAGWTHGYPPKPPEILPACEKVRAELRRSSEAPARNMREFGGRVAKLKPVLAEDWWRASADEVELFLGRFSAEVEAPRRTTAGEFTGLPQLDDRQFARSKLANLVRDKAHLAAMRQASGKTAQIDVSAEDLDHIESQVHSQRRHGIAAPAIARAAQKHLRDGPSAMAEPARELPSDWDIDDQHRTVEAQS